MKVKKNIFAIIGSASQNSSNLKLVKLFADLAKDEFSLIVFDNLRGLPHFNPELSIENTPSIILDFRESIDKADGILICTPEYVFSIPSGLKNAIEWCVSSTVFSDKPIALITASADGRKGHEELKLIMKTIVTKFTEQTTLLIRGVKGKFDTEGNLIDAETVEKLKKVISSFRVLLDE
jgi:chromate reductase, NAD(P)H dehydrogenase (quinone)